MIAPRRYLSKFMGIDGTLPIYGFGCRTPDDSLTGRSLMRFLGMAGATPLYGFSRCQFPRVGRNLMRYLAMDAQGVPVYGLDCCPREPSSSSSSRSSSSSHSSSTSSSSSSSSESFPSSSSASSSSSSSSSSSGTSGSYCYAQWCCCVARPKLFHFSIGGVTWCNFETDEPGFEDGCGRDPLTPTCAPWYDATCVGEPAGPCGLLNGYYNGEMAIDPTNLCRVVGSTGLLRCRPFECWCGDPEYEQGYFFGTVSAVADVSVEVICCSENYLVLVSTVVVRLLSSFCYDQPPEGPPYDCDKCDENDPTTGFSELAEIIYQRTVSVPVGDFGAACVTAAHGVHQLVSVDLGTGNPLPCLNIPQSITVTYGGAFLPCPPGSIIDPNLPTCL